MLFVQIILHHSFFFDGIIIIFRYPVCQKQIGIGSLNRILVGEIVRFLEMYLLIPAVFIDSLAGNNENSHTQHCCCHKLLWFFPEILFSIPQKEQKQNKHGKKYHPVTAHLKLI